MSLPYISACVPSIHVGIVRSTYLLFFKQQIHHVHERNGRNIIKNCLPPTNKSKRSFRLLSYSSHKSLCWWMSQFDKPEESGSFNVVEGGEKEWMTLRWNQYLLPRWGENNPTHRVVISPPRHLLHRISPTENTQSLWWYEQCQHQEGRRNDDVAD